MRAHLTWRDGVATFFAVAIGVVTVAVANAWHWPLIGSFRSAAIVVLALAVPMCAIGGNAFWESTAFAHPVRALRDPYLAVDMMLAPVAVGVVVIALVTGTQGWFLALAVTIGIKWLVATTRHAVESEPRIGAGDVVLQH
jgi:hypothetical protein